MALELGIIWITRLHGANTTGDEVWYLVESQALWHLHPQTLSVVAADFHHHTFSAFPPGTTIHTPHTLEVFRGPHGEVGIFEPGLPVLLAPFFNLGGELVARAGLMSVEIAGFVFLHRRVSLLAGLHRRSQVLLGLMFAAPAVLIATTQIFPDLISGVLLACAVVELAVVERSRQLTKLSAGVIAAAAGILPWLQVKNLAVGLIVLVVFVVMVLRIRGSWRSPVVVVAAITVSWVLLFTYNLRFFCRLTGHPVPPLTFNGNTLQLVMGLLFGRDQGIFVQLPTALVGVAGLWLARKVLPLATVSSLATVAVILVINGTYTSNSYGGYSFDGRFEWSIMPLLAAWTGWAISRWQARQRTLWAPIILVAGAWIYQAIPIVSGNHVYYNYFRSWDPALFGGWWPGLNSIIPQFDSLGQYFGAPAFALPLALGLCLLGFFAALRYARRDAEGPIASLTFLLILSVPLVVLAVSVAPELPTTPLSFSATTFGSAAARAAVPAGVPGVPILAIQPGTYRTTLSYELAGAASGTFSVWCQSAAGSTTAVRSRALTPGSPRSSTLLIHCTQPGTLFSKLSEPPSSRLTVQNLALWKTAV